VDFSVKRSTLPTVVNSHGYVGCIEHRHVVQA